MAICFIKANVPLFAFVIGGLPHFQMGKSFAICIGKEAGVEMNEIYTRANAKDTFYSI